MSERPLLIFPAPQARDRIRQKTGFANNPRYTHSRQLEKIAPQFAELAKTFEAQTTNVQNVVAGVVPEQVIVLEAIGNVVDFANAVRKLAGMEWLVEWAASVPSDDLDGEAGDEPIPGRLFLVMANQAAMRQLLQLWELYKANEDAPFPYGLTRFREVFKNLREVRRWSALDRLDHTALSDYLRPSESLSDNTFVRIEIELWFRENTSARKQASDRLRLLVSEERGEMIAETIVTEIRYHGALLTLPISAVRRMVEHRDTQVVLCGDVMFVRPGSQVGVVNPSADAFETISAEVSPPRDRAPIVAILDGLPVENHDLLRGFVILDDPENWASLYPVHQRVHGTAMSSLVVRGDLHFLEAPLERPVYVRPVLQPVAGIGGRQNEMMPEDLLPVDLIHSAVRRIFEGPDGAPGVAPSVRIINLSIGDSSRHFATDISPFARLLDWLSWKYGVLFVVSAGNHLQLELDVPRETVSVLSDDDREKIILQAIVARSATRRLLSPGESVNAITVGSCHADGGPVSTNPSIWNPCKADGMVSPISAVGAGYNRSIKPDILADGGRAHFREKILTQANAEIIAVSALAAPGQRVAYPANSEAISEVANMCGTSNAAAITTRAGAKIYETIEALRMTTNGAVLLPECTSSLIKAALVHSAGWGDARNSIQRALGSETKRQRVRDVATRILGYGRINLERAIASAEERATLIGCGVIGADESQIFSIPLPPGLAAKKTWRRLAITLAWITPVSSMSQMYKKALLQFESPQDTLMVERAEADFNAVKRGTVQHEVFVGDKATAFTDGDALSVIVTCRSTSAMLKQEKVPYGLLASVEVGIATGIQVFDEIQARLRVLVPTTVRNT